MEFYYAMLADVIVFIHLLYMGYVIFGQLAIMIGCVCRWGWIRNPWFRLSHLAMILIVVGEAMVNFQCPLTTWEAQLRRAAGQDAGAEEASFGGRLLHKIQFAGAEHWPNYINETYYVAGAIILTTALLVPLRFRRPRPITNDKPADLEPATASTSTTSVPAPAAKPPQ